MGHTPALSVTRALPAHKTGVNCKHNLDPNTLLRPANMGLSTPLHRPLGYFEQSQGCLACSPQQAQSAPQHMFPARLCLLPADSCCLPDCSLGGDCLLSCPEREQHGHGLLEFHVDLLVSLLFTGIRFESPVYWTGDAAFGVTAWSYPRVHLWASCLSLQW